MHTGTNSPAYPGMALWSQAQARREIAHAAGHARRPAWMRPATQAWSRPRRRPCEKSAARWVFPKCRFLSLLKAQPALIAYWQIAEAIARVYGIGTTEGAVRGALERLGRRGFLVRSRAAAGRAQGNRYAFLADPCPHITPPVFLESGMEASTEPGAASGIKPVPSLLEEKRDRRNLSVFSGAQDAPTASHRLESLSEEDVAFHWPNLAKAGFGTCQIRQILARLFQVGIGAENLAQGLTYAEWELEHGTMRDKNGEPVSHPLNWVFSSLARPGYYRRPQ